MRLEAVYGTSRFACLLEQGDYRLGRSHTAEIQFPSNWTLSSAIQLCIRVREDGSLWIRDGDGTTRSTNGTLLNNHYIGFESWTEWPRGSELHVGSNLKQSIRLNYVPEDHYELERSPRDAASLQEITIGRGAECTIVIEGSTISRKHCTIRRTGQEAILVDNSKNGVFINDRRVNQQCVLREGDEIKVGTHIFGWLSGELLKETSGALYRIDVRDLWLNGRISGTNLSIEPGQLVAFVGGSGAGKSSLLTTVAGQNLEYQGHILINGSELRECYSSMKQDIGFVPQDDIVHADLTVEEVLRYSARLKLPDPEQQREGVERVLRDLEMSHRRKAKVKDLSGGQRKRVSIGVELIADPRVLLLDEPTSGLDPGLDKRMMQLLRSLADKGKTVALVTHATNNVRLCDQVVFLGRGGYLCFAGKPDDCGRYFGVDGDFADIYQHLERSDEDIRTISNAFMRYNTANLPPIAQTQHTRQTTARLSFATRLKEIPAQCHTLLERDMTLLSRDVTSLALNALTAPVATLMIAVAANNRDIFSDTNTVSTTSYSDALRILFVIVCSTIWVGLSGSLQTIVKERSIFRRERAFNLLPEAYLASKFLIMASQALIQALLVAFTVCLMFEPPENVSHWGGWVAASAFATLVAIGAQALMLSSFVRNSQQASSIAPLLLIPQLVFGGVLFLLKGESDAVYPAIASRWTMRALGSISHITDLIPGGTDGVDKIAGAKDYLSNSLTIKESFTVLASQVAVFSLATLIILLFSKKNR